MKKILVFGAGLSASYLIKYLLAHSKKENWKVTVADQSLPLVLSKIKKHERAVAVELNIQDKTKRESLIEQHDLVVSLMPPSLHVLIAKDCLKYKKHLVTASYLTAEMKKLHSAAVKAGVLFLNEIGLDPGIDHLSAMEMIHDIQSKGGEITSFKSYCGGLVSPEFDTNPWHYKFTWNPRNVILAGNTTATFTQNGQLKFIPYNRIFLQTETILVKGYGQFEAYANRDSNGYIKPYGLEKAQTVLRGTLRKKGFGRSWNHLVKLGLTDDQLQLTQAPGLTWRELVTAFLPPSSLTPEQNLCHFLGINRQSREFKKLQWLGILENSKLGVEQGSPATALQKLLQQKWKLGKGELDMIVMQHQLTYTLNGKTKKRISSLVVKGEDEVYTAMAKTVGLPMAIAVKLILQNKISARGVVIPLTKEFYNPVLKELKKYGVEFCE
ncbi:MAG: saccharopine dehydrogenase NADP-binding domain-containing protein [Bacteroidia bacterium]|nr:saccharopine dehydrogenase NADP-binding domain-containing protein [Bacteroidia bacterium]